jgi:hypothetical protein
MPKIEARIEVKKTILLDFELPGVNWTGRGGSGGTTEYQLDRRMGESWQLRVSTENAIETAEILNKLAAAIVQAFKAP